MMAVEFSIVNDFLGAKVAFLQNNAINESLGLCDLSGHLTAQGVSTKLFLEREEKNLLGELKNFAPNLVVIPCDLLGHNTALRLAHTAKNAVEAPVVLGGTHPTFYQNIVLRDGVDYAFAGEAEGVVTDLLAAVLGKRPAYDIPNLILRQDGGIRANPLRPNVADMNDFAMPDRELYYRYPFIGRFPWKKFGTGRGCLNSCGYCFNRTYREMMGSPSRFLRRKNPERISLEINEVRRRHPLDVAHFSDDLFNSGFEWLETFLEEYRKNVAVPFSCNVYVGSLDEKSIKALKNAGCRVMAVGLEMADETMRREWLNKPFSNEHFLGIARKVKEAGIHLVTFNILGLPPASLDADLDTLAFNQQVKTDHARVTILVPFPKSALTVRLIRHGYLSPEYEERIYQIEDLPSTPGVDMFKSRDMEQTKRLLNLWALVMKWKIPISIVRRIVRSRWSALLFPLSFLTALANEKKIFGLKILDGFRYFLHVKSPALKTSNYVSFI
jgi:anaerobic magnesium-protoporphyrin IX monomethyl ester cyclase